MYHFVLIFQKEQENDKASQEIEEKLISTAFYKLVSCIIYYYVTSTQWCNCALYLICIFFHLPSFNKNKTLEFQKVIVISRKAFKFFFHFLL